MVVKQIKKFILFVFASIITLILSQNSTTSKNSKYEKYMVTIYRDTWGVPHIFGEKDRDTAYGLGFAHAEDDFETIQNILLASRGKLAKFFGSKAAPNDYMVKLLDIWDIVNSNYSTLPSDIVEICEGYADGINHYIDLNPKKAVKGIHPITGKDIIAGFIHRMPLMFGLDKTLGKLASNKKINNQTSTVSALNSFDQKVLGSNVVAVSPSRSEDNYTRLLINSHQPWTGPVAWYEAHLNSNEGWNMVGGLFPGSPVIFVGHNEHIGWSHTVNSPDLIDVYELEMNPENTNQYFIDGKKEELEISEAAIEVKLWGPFKWTFKREIIRSKFGPVIKNDQGYFAIRYAGFDEFRQLEQWFRMNKSKTLDEFESAMKIMAIPMFNTVYADKKGNTFYIYNALFPNRRDGYEWSGVIPGNTSETLWDSYLGYDDLPRIYNAESGFIQNCNSSPFKTTDGKDNPDENLYPKKLGIETFQTNRALRAHEIYGNDKSINREEFYKYKYDTFYSKKSVLATNLSRFLNEVKSGSQDVNTVLEMLRSWDLNTDSTSIGVHYALEGIKPVYDPDKYVYNYDLILTRLLSSIKKTKEEFGRLDVEWGKIQRLIRGNTNLSLSGGPDIFRAIYTKDKGPYKEAVAGDCYFQIVEWSPSGEVQSQSIHQFGASTLDPHSPHYNDQSYLFSKNEMKPIWINLKDIKLNLWKSYSPGGEIVTKE